MPNGIPIIPFIPKNYVNKENQKGKEKKDEKTEDKNINANKTMPASFIQTPIFINPINKIPKDFYNKFQYRKMRPFGERTGDWICKKCRNLNFAFRTECNRCKLPKKEAMENQKNKENKIKIKKKNNISESDTVSNPNISQNINSFNFNNISNQNTINNRYKNYHLYNYENKNFKNKDSNNYEEK